MAEIANDSIFSQTDASNTGSLPGISGSSPPSQIDDSIRAALGAVKREHDWRNAKGTMGGSSNAFTITYTVAPAAYYTGQRFMLLAGFSVTGSATVNVNALGAKTIKKLVAGVKTNLASGDIVSGDYVDLLYDGTEMVWVNKGTAATPVSATDSAAGIVELATTTETLTGTDANRAATSDSIAALWEQGSDVASAGTISLGEGGYFNITGTTTITDIDFATDKAGRTAWVKFAGALTLTHNASTLIIPGGANITTAAGDTACFISEGSDVVRCVAYTRASGTAVTASPCCDFLGFFSTASGASASLGSLSLTNYKFLRLILNQISHSSGSHQSFLFGTSTSDDVSLTAAITSGTTLWGYIDIELSTGLATPMAMTTGGVFSGIPAVTTITNSATTVSGAPSGGNWDAGAIGLYGFR